MFRTVIIFIYSVKLTLEVHFSPNMYLIASIIFVEKNIFSFLSYIALWLKSIVYTNVGIFLFPWLILMSMPPAINYCGFTVNLKSWRQNFFFFKRIFGICIFIYIWYSDSQILQNALQEQLNLNWNQKKIPSLLIQKGDFV